MSREGFKYSSATMRRRRQWVNAPKRARHTGRSHRLRASVGSGASFGRVGLFDDLLFHPLPSAITENLGWIKPVSGPGAPTNLCRFSVTTWTRFGIVLGWSLPRKF